MPENTPPDDATTPDGDEALQVPGRQGTLGASATIASPSRKDAAARRAEASDGSHGEASRSRGGRSRKTTVLVVSAILLVTVVVPVFRSSLGKTPKDKYGISYGGGPIEANHFQRVVRPGSPLFVNGFMDSLYLYPADQQNYIISKSSDQGGKKPDSVLASSRDRVQVEYQVATYFRLNSDRLREFHEQLGLKYRAYTAAGWAKLITDTFRQQIESALQSQTRRYDVADLYANRNSLESIQLAVQKSLKAKLREALGAEYFCGPKFKPKGPCGDLTFVVKRIDIPKSVQTAYEQNRTSNVAILTEANKTKQRTEEAKGIAALADALDSAGENYVLLKAIESGKINFWVLPDKAGVTLQAPKDGTGTPATGGAATTTPGN